LARLSGLRFWGSKFQLWGSLEGKRTDISMDPDGANMDLLQCVIRLEEHLGFYEMFLAMFIFE
jgi:hypothetical protein